MGKANEVYDILQDGLDMGVSVHHECDAWEGPDSLVGHLVDAGGSETVDGPHDWEVLEAKCGALQRDWRDYDEVCFTSDGSDGGSDVL